MTHPPSVPPPGRRRRNPRDTRERLTRAALDLFTTQGYHATTTPEIARRAGVAEGTIYRHFRSKEQLLNELYRGGVRLLARPLADGRADAPCRERLTAIAEQWRELAARDPAVVRMVVGRRFVGLLDERSRQVAGEFRAALVALIAAGKAAGAVRAGSAELWSDVWFRLITLTLERVAAGEWRPGDDMPALVAGAAWDAIRATPAGQDRGTA